MALSKSFSPSDRTRFARLALVIVEELTPILRDVLENEIPPSQIYYKVKSDKALFQKLRNDQLLIIQDANSNGYRDFDITLLYTLIRNLCPNIPSPTQGWGISEMPNQGETSLGDDIERIRLTKNNLYSHASSTCISETDYNEYWTVIYTLCQRMGNHLHKNYIQSLQIAQHRPLDEELEKEWIEKLKESAESEKSMFEMFTAIEASLRSLEKGPFSTTAIVDAKLKDPANKESADIFLKTTSDLLNYTVDCINEVTTEAEITEIYITVEEFLKNESNEISRDSMKIFFDKLSSKIKTYANQQVRRITILAKFTRFMIHLKREYGADIKSHFSSLLLQLLFFSEEGYKLYNKDLESGKIGQEILDLLLYPSYLACFDLQTDDLIILLNNQTIHHGTGDREQFGGWFPRKADGNFPSIEKEKEEHEREIRGIEELRERQRQEDLQKQRELEEHLRASNAKEDEIKEAKEKQKREQRIEAERLAKQLEEMKLQQRQKEIELEKKRKYLEPLKEPWRKISSKFDDPWTPEFKEELLQKINAMKPAFGISYFNILLLGQAGSGKSSFFNTCATAIVNENRLVTTNLVFQKATKSVTTTLEAIPMKAKDGRILPLRLYDCNIEYGVSTEDIRMIVLGHVKSGYKINPVAPVDEDDQKYRKFPDIKDRMHCVVYVVDAENPTEQLTDPRTKEQLQFVRETTQHLPQLVLLNKIDKLRISNTHSLRDVFRSQDVKDACIKASEYMHIPLFDVLPMSSYHEENLPTLEKDILALFCLFTMMERADYFIYLTEGAAPGSYY